jgi:glutathione synthase/RimK-type ligase-like ATP-grasp enzyme
LDHFCKPEHRPYLTAFSIEQIVSKISQWFSFPVIIKQNSGSQGKNVFLCKNVDELYQAVSRVFNRQDKNYDYLVLAQEFVKIKKEYRVIYFEGKVELVYEKSLNGGFDGEGFENLNFGDNISPYTKLEPSR